MVAQELLQESSLFRDISPAVLEGIAAECEVIPVAAVIVTDTVGGAGVEL